jgi:hypothetical protein
MAIASGDTSTSIGLRPPRSGSRSASNVATASCASRSIATVDAE